jgi:hypothetical protein
MIEWYTWVVAGVATLAGLLALVLGLLGRKPDDISLGSAVVVEVLLIVQLVIAIVAPAAGNLPTGSPLEFYIYLISAILLPPVAVFWALIERNRWSTVVVAVACLAVAVMVYRMYQIWAVQVA